MNLQGSLHACLLSVSFQVRSLLLIAILLPSLAMAGLKVSHADIQALIDKGYFMTAYQQCVDKGYTDDKTKILDFFHQQVDTLEKGIPEGAKVTKISGAGRFPSEKIEMPDGITVFRKDLALLEGMEMGSSLPFVDELNFKLSDYLKLNLVPPTKARGSRVYQLFVSEARTGADLEYPDGVLATPRPEFAKLAVWDVFTGQIDRSTPLNWMVSESGEIIAIDNSLSLRQTSAFYSKGERTVGVKDLTPNQLEYFFTKLETLEVMKNEDALNGAFYEWTEGMGLSSEDYATFRHTLIANAKDLVKAVDDHKITTSNIEEKGNMLNILNRHKLSSRYRRTPRQSSKPNPACN
ncbi:MAG: hypothetical protein ACR2PT_03660 [Endozoicomonas sp.]